MRVWIDATQPGSRLRVFSMTLIERHLRVFHESEQKLKTMRVLAKKAGIDGARRRIEDLANRYSRPSEIWIELPADSPDPDWIPAELVADLPVRWVRDPGSTRERLQRALRAADGEPVLAFSGDSLVDPRIIEYLSWRATGSTAFLSDSSESGAVVARLDEPLPEAPDDDAPLSAIVHTAVRAGAIKQLPPDDIVTYVKKLRRSIQPYAFRIDDDGARARVERFLFESNYKGSTDFMTKYVYPPLVWRMLHPLARNRVSPNTVTFAGVVCCFGAIPFFAAGMWVPGLALAYVMSVLDSVDGKLARVTFQSSNKGDVLDHGMDLVHPPFWYWAWGVGLQQAVSPDSLALMLTVIIAGYVLQRVIEGLAIWRLGLEIHVWRKVDTWFRLFTARRNPNLALLTLFALFGRPDLGLAAVAFWTALCLLLHILQILQALFAARRGKLRSWMAGPA